MRIIYTHTDGLLRQVIPGKGWEDRLDEIIAKDIPAGATDITKVPEAAIPSDRTFRNAWKKGTGPTIDVDIVKARNIVRDKIRIARAAQFKALDEAYLKADEAGDVATKQLIAQQKQTLRDAPADPSIDNAQDVNALKSVRPAGIDWTKA